AGRARTTGSTGLGRQLARAAGLLGGAVRAAFRLLASRPARLHAGPGRGRFGRLLPAAARAAGPGAGASGDAAAAGQPALRHAVLQLHDRRALPEPHALGALLLHAGAARTAAPSGL